MNVHLDCGGEVNLGIESGGNSVHVRVLGWQTPPNRHAAGRVN